MKAKLDRLRAYALLFDSALLSAQVAVDLNKDPAAAMKRAAEYFEEYHVYTSILFSEANIPMTI